MIRGPRGRAPGTFEGRERRRVSLGSAQDDDRVSVPPFEAITFRLTDLRGPEGL